MCATLHILDNCTTTKLYLHLSPGVSFSPPHPQPQWSRRPRLVSLTFKYCRLEKILPQPGKSQGISSLLAAFLWGEWEQDSCALCLTPDLPHHNPIFPVLPNSPEPNLGSVLIPGQVRIRLALTPRPMGSKEAAKQLKSDTSQGTPALSVSAIRLPVQRLGHLLFYRGLRGSAEFQLHLSI